MTVSVIIPCFNNASYVAEAIESVIHQTVTDVEIIVIDDGSTDNSADVVSRFDHVKLIRQTNRGVSAARNNGAKLASGRSLLFLDADDRLHPGAIEAHLAAFASDPRCVLTFGTCDVIDSRGSVLYSHRQPPSAYGFWDILLGVTPNPSQCMIRRDAFDEVGRFNEQIVFGEDWDCFLRLSRMGNVSCHGVVVADYRKHGGQSTRYPSRMLVSMVKIIDTHAASFEASRENAAKFSRARAHYARFFGKWIPAETLRDLRASRTAAAVSSVAVFLRFLPHSAYGFPQLVTTIGKKR